MVTGVACLGIKKEAGAAAATPILIASGFRAIQTRGVIAIDIVGVVGGGAVPTRIQVAAIRVIVPVRDYPGATILAPVGGG